MYWAVSEVELRVGGKCVLQEKRKPDVILGKRIRFFQGLLFSVSSS